MPSSKPSLHRFWLILPIILAGALCYYFLFPYINFASLHHYHHELKQWSVDHYALSLSLFMLFYILAITLSMPGGAMLTVLGGYLFGPWVGLSTSVICATIGATCLFALTRWVLSDWLSHKANTWVKRFEKGFQKNALTYLLILRFIPVVPFWMVNIVSGAMNIPIKTFVSTTFIGIIPGTFVYTMLGHGLNHLFAQNQTPNLSILFEPHILLPLVGLAMLSFIPMLYKKMTGHDTP